MNLAELGKTVAKFAPLLGAIVPLPGASLIGHAIAETFGGSLDNPADLIHRIEGDAEASVKLKQIETQGQADLARIAVDHIRAANEDRANARAREIALKDTTPATIAKLFISGHLFMLTVIILLLKFSTVNAFEEKILEMTIVGMSNAIMLILAYYFGATNKG
jgi:hypothetical protein